MINNSNHQKAYSKIIKVHNGDITTLKVDAIVNAANRALLGGGSVDGAIHRAAGFDLVKECMQLRKDKYPDGLPTGEAVITKGYDLPAKFVIHTVGPIWKDGNSGEESLLYNCYFNSLLVAKENNVRTIAFPEISTGKYGFPKELARPIAVRALEDFIHKYPEAIDEIILVIYEK